MIVASTSVPERSVMPQRDALVGQIRVHVRKDRLAQPVPLQQMAEVEDRPSGLARPHWGHGPLDVRNALIAQFDPGKAAYRLAVIQRSALRSIHRIDCFTLEPIRHRIAERIAARTGNTAAASSPAAAAGAHPSGRPWDNAAQSAPEDGSTAPPRSARRSNQWRLRLTLRQELFPPRHLLLHRVAQAGKGRLPGHRRGSLWRRHSLSDQAENSGFSRRSLIWPMLRSQTPAQVDPPQEKEQRKSVRSLPCAYPGTSASARYQSKCLILLVPPERLELPTL